MIAEPATTLTDYAIAVESLLFALLLLRFGRVEEFWSAAFCSVSFAAVCGGTYHGFREMLPPASLDYLWRGVVLALASASFWTVVAAAWKSVPAWRWGLLGLAALKLVVALALNQTKSDFIVSVIDYLSALAIALLLYFWQSRKRYLAGLGWIMSGITTSGIAGAALIVPWPQWIHFSAEAGYHLIQMVGLYFLYQGIWRNAQYR
ncbi:MAG: DUF6962 family protein [Thainema sp.]